MAFLLGNGKESKVIVAFKNVPSCQNTGCNHRSTSICASKFYRSTKLRYGVTIQRGSHIQTGSPLTFRSQHKHWILKMPKPTVDNHFPFIPFSYMDQSLGPQSSSRVLSKVQSLEIQASGERVTTSQYDGVGGFCKYLHRLPTSYFHKMIGYHPSPNKQTSQILSSSPSLKFTNFSYKCQHI